jgi:tetratricopeptide (TPR) repeat protein/tRNA A-37 threonylcarbamoyl transferase component Bud32
MNPERWLRLQELFSTARELGPAERNPYLDRVCEDAQLRVELDSLLQADQASHVVIDQPAFQFVTAGSAPESNESWLGRRIGPYELTALIGRGGMGEVYRARRADAQYDQEVAIKLVAGGYDVGYVPQRFRAERQILANLEHPNISRLLDGGATDLGMPYLVMELVEGEPIDSYCERRSLPIDARLRLFCDVCSAVSYAHQRLVVHRDLKPSNILVTNDGTVKLLDFGVAKLLQPIVPEAAAEPVATLMHAFTPAFASPEQVLGLAITTASDVYSLGVVLYHLLAGRSPYGHAVLTTQDAIREVCERQPLRPSAGASGARMHPHIDHDLDAIALKALRKEPESRYASVEQLAEDVRRHLAGLPVAARGGELGYRARKFIGRHRLGVGATAIVLLAITVGVVATLREASIARRQAQIAQVERARAERRFNDVRKLSDALIFDINDAIRNLPGATPARRVLLDRAVAYLDSVAKDAEGQPDLQRELAWGYQRLATVQGSSTESSLGDAQAALLSNRKALTYFEATAKANPHNIADQLNVAMMHRILSFGSLAREEGRQELERALDITRGLLAVNPDNSKVKNELSIEYQDIGFVQDAIGNRAAALSAYRANRDLKLEIIRADPGNTAVARGIGMATVILGDAQGRLGMIDDAIASMRDGIAIYQALPKGMDDVHIARELSVSRVKYADVMLMHGDIAAAQAAFHEARHAVEPLARQDPNNILLQDDVAWLDYHDGKIELLLGRYVPAQLRLQRALARFEQLHGPSPGVDETAEAEGTIQLWLGDAFAKAREWPLALQGYQRAIEVLGTVPDADTDDDTRCRLALGYVRSARAWTALRRLPQAQQAAARGLDIIAPSLVPAYQDVPALYVAAEGYARRAQAFAVQAVGAPAGARESLETERRAWLAKSLAVWRRIPNATPLVTTSLFEAFNPFRAATPE